MGFNIIGNSIALLFFLLILIALVVIVTVGNQMVGGAQSVVGGVITLPSWATGYKGWIDFLLVNLSFLFYFLVIISFYSSFIDSSDMKTYFAAAIGGVVVTIIVIQVGQLMWNQIAVLNNILDFSDFVDNLWFVNNFATILVINLLASFSSFVFAKRGGGEL
jgi:hypothetical protein